MTDPTTDAVTDPGTGPAESIAARTRRALQVRETDDPGTQAPDPVTDPATDQPTPAVSVDPAVPAAGSADTSAATDTDTATDTATDTDAGTDTRPAGRRRAPMQVLVAAVVAAVLALVFAVVAGVVWAHHAGEGSGSGVRAREDALLAARQGMAALNTADYRHAADALARWKAATTGTLNKELTDEGEQAVKAIADAELVTTAVVRSAALTALDTTKGTATVIASLSLHRQPAKGTALNSRTRFRGTLTRVHGAWKLSALGPVAVSLG